MAPIAVTRRARSEADPRSNVTSSRNSKPTRRDAWREVVGLQPRRELNARRRRRTGQLRDHQEVGAGQRLRRIEHGTASVGEQELPACAARLGDAIRPRQRHQRRRRNRLVPHLCSRCLDRRRRPAARKPAHAVAAWRPVPLKATQALVEIGRRTTETTLDNQGGDVRRCLCCSARRRIHHHRRESWRQRERAHTGTAIRQAAVAVKCTDQDQLATRGRQCPGRWCIEPAKRRRIGDAPSRQIHQQAREVRGADLGLGEWDEPRRFRLVPQPIAHARLGSARTSHALIGRRPRNATRFKPRHADVRLIARQAFLAAVHDDAHAVDCDRRLRDRRRQHDLAPASLRRLDGTSLRARVEAAKQLDDVGRRIVDALTQPLDRAPDLGLARQERQHRARLLADRSQNCRRHGVRDPAFGGLAEIARGHREGATFRPDHRGIVHEPRHARAVERRRHHEKAQIVAQSRAAVERQRQAEIGIERSLMELVEDHRRDALERGIVDDHAREDTFGQHLDSRLGADPRVEPRPETHRLADPLAQGPRHTLGRRPRRQPAWLDQQNPAVTAPCLVEQHQRHPCRLAGSWRRNEHGLPRPGQRLEQVGQGLVDRQGLQRRHGGWPNRSPVIR